MSNSVSMYYKFLIILCSILKDKTKDWTFYYLIFVSTFKYLQL